MEKPISIDDLGVPLFLETPRSILNMVKLVNLSNTSQGFSSLLRGRKSEHREFQAPRSGQGVTRVINGPLFSGVSCWYLGSMDYKPYISRLDTSPK